jgi:predicted nucleotidyltransferase
VRERILHELSRIEEEHDVRVLMGVESGSRAWGFASSDSDYDVRFIYVHGREWYLSVFEGSDTIEKMLPQSLDFSGWDLRKTLRLFSKCNLALNEWLGSPILYAEVPDFHQRLCLLIPRFFNPIRAMHHYRSMATRALDENLRGSEMGIKKLFYVLRPLLACRWIGKTNTQPPTAFKDLLSPMWVTGEEKEWITRLLQEKGKAVEAQRISLDAGIPDRIRSELEEYKGAAELLESSPALGSQELDELFRDCIGGDRLPPRARYFLET